MSLWRKLFPRSEARIRNALEKGNVEKVQAMLKDEPDLALKKDSEGATLLHEAAFGGNKDVAKMLLATKADVNARDNYGRAPLYYAAAMGNQDVAEDDHGERHRRPAKAVVDRADDEQRDEGERSN